MAMTLTPQDRNELVQWLTPRDTFTRNVDSIESDGKHVTPIALRA